MLRHRTSNVCSYRLGRRNWKLKLKEYSSIDLKKNDSIQTIFERKTCCWLKHSPFICFGKRKTICPRVVPSFAGRTKQMAIIQVSFEVDAEGTCLWPGIPSESNFRRPSLLHHLSTPRRNPDRFRNEFIGFFPPVRPSTVSEFLSIVRTSG